MNEQDYKEMLKSVDADIDKLMKFFYGVTLTYYLALSQGRSKMMIFGTDLSKLFENPIFESILLLFLSASYFLLMHSHSVRTDISLSISKKEIIDFGCFKKTSIISIKLIAIAPMCLPPVILVYFYQNYIRNIFINITSLETLIGVVMLLCLGIFFIISGINTHRSIKKVQYKNLLSRAE